jgi:hypothetical protein
LTDRIHSLTVVLDVQCRDDSEYLAAIIAAIRQLKGVTDVGVNVADPGQFAAQRLARSEVRKELTEFATRLWLKDL